MMTKLLCFTAVLALGLCVAVSTAVAGDFAGKAIALDLQDEAAAANDAKTKDGVVTMAPPASGTAIAIQVFVETGATLEITAYNFTFANDANAFSDLFTINGISGILPLALPPAGGNSIAGGFLPGTGATPTVPANDYLATITITPNADVPEGTTVTLSAAELVNGTVTDSAVVTNAVLTFQTPAGPALSASPALATIPRDGSVTSTVTLANIAVGDAIDWTVTVSGDATVTVQGQTGLSFSTTAAATSESITLEATGAGSATATVAASVGGTAVDPSAQVVFSEQVPAELAAFGGEVVDNGVVLNWATASQTNNAGWRVMRSTDGVNYEVASDLIPGAGTSDALLNYSFVDEKVPAAEQAYYRLDQIDLDGSIHASNAIEVILGSRFMDIPTEFGTNVYPNPFNPSTTIAYDLPGEASVAIVIYDALGQEIRRLVTEQKAAGRYTVQWDARDNLGRSVGSGVYIAKIEAGSFSASQKMLLLK
jgi:hypothetical protein